MANSAKSIFVTLKIRDMDMIFNLISNGQSDFARILFSQNSASVKFCVNKTLAKTSKFTVFTLLSGPTEHQMSCASPDVLK